MDEAAANYRNTIAQCCEMGNMAVWYNHLDVEELIQQNEKNVEKEQVKKTRAIIEKAMNKNSERAVAKLMETVDGKLRIKSNPPIIVPIRDIMSVDRPYFDFNFQYSIQKALEIYKKSLAEDRKRLIDQYEVMGRENGDPLVLQIKEAEKSVLEDYYGNSVYKKCGRRVVEGQRAIQTTGDILLGWVQEKLPDGREIDYYVRQKGE